MDLSTLPFAPYREAAGTIYLSGELSFTEDMTLTEGLSAQTERVLARIETIPKGLGLDRSAIVSADPKPVRAAVRADLAMAARVEISVIAVR